MFAVVPARVLVAALCALALLLSGCAAIEEQLDRGDDIAADTPGGVSGAEGDGGEDGGGEDDGGGDEGSGDEGSGDGGDGADLTPAFDPANPEPPVVSVLRGDIGLDLTPWSWCWTPPAGDDDGICADGFAPDPPPTLPGSGDMSVRFPLAFEFNATVFDAATDERLSAATLEGSPSTGWALPAPPSTPARIELFGNGPEGDVIVTFLVNG